MTKRYLGNIITQNPTAPAGDFTNSAAKGVWSLEEQLAYQKAGLWPVPGNLPLDVEDVFSTTLYTGSGQDGTVITNDIDLEGEGGLIWIKRRNAGTEHLWQDSARGAGTGTSYKQVFSNLTSAQNTTTNEGVTSFNSNGFTVDNGSDINATGNPYASWTFRKAPKFFDVVTWDGNSTAGREIAHNLGATVGCIMVKCTTAASNWLVYHRGVASDAETDALFLNLTNAAADSANYWDDTAPTSTHFTVGIDDKVNQTGRSYVAYLFAHNDGDGGFNGGDIIKCGSYVGDDQDDGPEIDLGFEPQWLLVKNASSARNWVLVDNMRGISNVNAGDKLLFPNTNSADDPANGIILTPTGFKCDTGGDNFNGNGHTMIYIAIRRGTKVPESGTEVFGLSGDTVVAYTDVGFPVDMVLGRTTNSTQNWRNFARMIGGNFLVPNLTNPEASLPAGEVLFDSNDGFYNETNGTPNIWHQWKRAPQFCDVVAYTGDSASGRTVSHNLGVAPEMMWIKRRDILASWCVYHSAISPSGSLDLDNDGASNAPNAGARFDNTAPTSSVFTVGNFSETNNNNNKYIAYLFATLPGISKVGSYTGNGTSQTIDCGFTSGARFILVKRTDSTGDWYVWDTERGIVAGNDPHLSLNTTAAEVTSDDSIDPENSGFIVNQVSATNINVSSGEYIFYAIA